MNKSIKKKVSVAFMVALTLVLSLFNNCVYASDEFTTSIYKGSNNGELPIQYDESLYLGITEEKAHTYKLFKRTVSSVKTQGYYECTSDTECCIYFNADGSYTIVSLNPITSSSTKIYYRYSDSDDIQSKYDYKDEANNSVLTGTGLYYDTFSVSTNAFYIPYCEMYMFENQEDAINYLQTGDTSKAVRKPVPKYEKNNELCFDSFLVEKINHPDLLGGTGARVSYSYGDKLFEAIQEDYDSSMKMHFDVAITYEYTILDDGLINAETKSEYVTLYASQEQEIELHTKQNDIYLFDFGSVINSNDYPVLYSYLYGVDNSMVDGFGARATYNFISGLTFIDPSTIHDVFNLDFGDEFFIDYLDVDITGYVYDYGDSIVMSNNGWGHVELVTGQNSSFVNEYDSDTGESVPGSASSGGNYYNVVTETDMSGNAYFNYYYYDTTNNTVTPSVGEHNSVSNILLTFANPLSLEGAIINNSSSSSSSGGSGGNLMNIPEIIIEDDDYTDTALREDLADGFGLFDNRDTELKADGYLSIAAAFFNNIDPELGGILTFGISSVVVIGILRAALRR